MDHKIVEKLFDSQASTLSDCFRQEGAGLRIPPYQRMYAWDNDHIERLFVDLSVSLGALRNREGVEPKTHAFLGTILLVSEAHAAKEHTWRHAQSFEIVDGQQRLITLALAICHAADQVRILCRRALAELQDQEFEEFLETEVTFLLDDVIDSLARTRPNSEEPGKWVPAIVRSEDNRSYGTDYEYRSFIASFLHRFIIHLNRNRDSDEIFQFCLSESSARKSEERKHFQSRLDKIGSLIESLIENGSVNEEVGEDVQGAPAFLPDGRSLFRPDYKELRSLFIELRAARSEDSDRIRLLAQSGSIDNERVVRLLRAIAVNRYLLHNLVITVVKVGDDNYAYDIFEALNTTGEPLTALETFKPALVKYYSAPRWTSEDAELYFRQVEDLVLNKRNRNERIKAHNELIIDAALLVDGEKRLNHISDQRSFLQSSLNRARAVDKSRVTAFVKTLADVALFRDRVWKIKTLDEVLGECGQNAQLVRLLMALFIQSNTTLAAPIIERYWIWAEKTGDWPLFCEALKAIAAFTVLRRAATTDTAGIDSDFRRLMEKGAGSTKMPICFGISDWRDEPPSADSLRSACRHLLDTSRAGRTKLNITCLESWQKKVRYSPIYSSSRTITKFLLLAADQGTVCEDQNPYLKRKARGGRKDLLTFDFWRAGIVESIEHIAPISRGTKNFDSSPGWTQSTYNDLYEDPKLLHTLGNLTLLPKAQNSDVSNLQWIRKQQLFQAFSARDDDGIKGVIEKAKEIGFPFSKSVTQRLLADDYGYNPLVASVANATDWSLEIVHQRTNNLLELAWFELSGWIGFES